MQRYNNRSVFSLQVHLFSQVTDLFLQIQLQIYFLKNSKCISARSADLVPYRQEMQQNFFSKGKIFTYTKVANSQSISPSVDDLLLPR